MATDPSVSHAKPEWFADDAFWMASYDLMFPDSRFVTAVAELEQILALAQCSGGDVLDLACGPGRHSVPLAQRGFKVTGVDRSAFLLDHARERAAQAEVSVEFLESDMRDFRRPTSYDLALNLFTSFGFFRDHADNQHVLDNVSACLRPGGALVLDVSGKEVLARVFNPTASTELPSGLIVRRRRVVDNWSRLENEWIYLQEDGVAHRFRFAHWVYSGQEITGMFEQAGFAEVEVFGGYAREPYGPEAKRLVVLGRKPSV